MKKRIISTLCALSLLLTLAACSEGEVGAGGSEDAGGSESSRSAQESAAEDARGTAGAVMTGEPVGTAAVTSGSEPGSAGTRERTEPPVVVASNEIRLNTELLAEFGMTLSELEVKHGAAVSGRLENERATYFFKEGSGGYSFEIWDEESTLNSQSALSDGTARIKDVDRSGNRVEFRFFRDGRVSDLFLDMKSVIAVEEIKKISGIEIGVNWNYEPVFSSSYVPPVSSEWDPYFGGHDGFWETVFWLNEEFTVVIRHSDEGIIFPDSVLHMAFSPQGIGRQ